MSSHSDEILDALFERMKRRSMVARWLIVLEARVGTPKEIEAWLGQNAAKRYAISSGLYGFEDEDDALAFRMRFG